MTPGQMIDQVCQLLNIDPLEQGLQIVNSRDFVAQQQAATSLAPWVEQQGLGSYTAPLTPFPLVPTRPALVVQSEGALAIQQIVDALLTRYPTAHTVTLLNGALPQQIALGDVKSLPERTEATSLYLPPLSAETALRDAEGPHWVVTRLLGPDGCPWDVKQTHQSLRTGLIEEAYEVLEALDNNDMVALEEELGDLLLQSLVHAEMARQAGHFSINDVYAHLAGKLINRHPHVFGTLAVDGEGTVLRNWEAIKAQELAAQGRERHSALDGVPAALPALAAGQKLCKKAARVGFEWPSLTDVWSKLQEELSELESELHSNDPARLTDEMGDVLFCLVNLARWLHIDAETALRHANSKFRQRFTAIEQTVEARGVAVSDLSLEEMLALWEQAKH